MTEVHPRYLVPREDISCPGCGVLYRGSVCIDCEECKQCCSCEKPKFVTAKAVKEFVSEHGEFPKQIPFNGAKFWPTFAEYYSKNDERIIEISVVYGEQSDNSWSVKASDGTWYDAFWCERLKLWVSHL